MTIPEKECTISEATIIARIVLKPSARKSVRTSVYSGGYVILPPCLEIMPLTTP